MYIIINIIIIISKNNDKTLFIEHLSKPNVYTQTEFANATTDATDYRSIELWTSRPNDDYDDDDGETRLTSST